VLSRACLPESVWLLMLTVLAVLLVDWLLISTVMSDACLPESVWLLMFTVLSMACSEVVESGGVGFWSVFSCVH